VFALPLWIDWSAPVLVYAFAMLLGSTPERIVGGVGAAGWLCGNVLQPHWYGQMLPAELAKDLLIFAVVTALALRHDRWWLLAAGSATLLAIATDVAGMIMPVHPWAFGTAMWTWGWIFLAALAAGTWVSWRSGRGGQVRQTT
jgi:hypothetical protein